MERRVSVNARLMARVTPDGLPEGWSAVEPSEQGGGSPAARTARPDQGPCLYLGPGGERCWRPALANGFCAVHSPHPSRNPRANLTRFWAAAGAIGALLWPYLEFVVREVIRWARSH
jgi:hypothetical protein